MNPELFSHILTYPYYQRGASSQIDAGTEPEPGTRDIVTTGDAGMQRGTEDGLYYHPGSDGVRSLEPTELGAIQYLDRI